MPTYLSPGVYVEEVQAGSRPIEGVGTAVAAFVGFAAEGPVNSPTLVSNWTQFTQTFGDFIEDSYLAHSVYGYFLNGGGACYIVRVGAPSQNGTAGSGGSGRPAAVTGGSGRSAGGSGGPKALEATPHGLLGGRYRLSVQPGQYAGDVTVEVTDGAGEDDGATLTVKVADRVEERFTGLSTKRGKENIVTAVREKSRILTIEEDTKAPVPAKLAGTSLVLAAPVPEAPAVPERVSPAEYIGDAAQRTGFGGLEAIDDITMVLVPDLMSAYQRGAIDLDGVKAVQQAMIDHCDSMGDRMAILDPPPDLTAQQVKAWRNDEAGYDSKYAALYYPWIEVFDPLAGVNRAVPPGGHMAGIWARSDATRGVHKAPANEVVRGAVGLVNQITRAEQELLNPIGINCVRAFPGRGIRVWGARTLSSDPAWRYLNVRRLFNYLEASILNGTQWVVFEPNDNALWARIRRTIAAFLVNEWRKGALFGLTPDEAFFVKCDAETNPAEGIDAGQVLCEVGVAPVKPAEFVIFRLSQFSGGVSLVNE
jgi:phage tail sheath protein FI